MSLIGFYPGSFDPVTNGHVDVIQRSLNFVDKLVIGVGVHHGKKPLLSGDERIVLIQEAVEMIDGGAHQRVKIIKFDKLAVDAAKENSASVILRGVRDATDFDYEMQMAGMNNEMLGEVDTVLLPGRGELRHISSNLVRQIVALGGDVSAFVPKHVVTFLAEKLLLND